MTSMPTSTNSVAAKQVAPMPRRGSGPWKVAFLGAGYIAEWHAKAIRLLEGVNLVAVCDKAISRAQACASAFAIPKAYGSLDEMLAGEKLDAVHVLLPPDRHFPAAKTILEAGVNVFMEKPMCTTAEECEALIRLAAERGARIGVGHNFLFYEIYEQLRRDMREGVLGRIDHVTLTWNKELPQVNCGPFDIWMLKRPENILLEIGPHAVSQMLDLVGQAEQMQVRASNPVELPTGETFFRRWQADGHKEATAVRMDFSFVPGFSEHTVHVRGSLGSGIVDFQRNTYVLRRHTPRDDDFDRHAMTQVEARSLARQGRSTLRNYVLSKFKLSKKGSAYATSIAAAMRAFYKIETGEADRRISGEMGRDTIALCQKLGELAGLAKRKAPESRPAVVMSQPPKTLVLGATGFIGQELVRQLVARGYATRVLVRNASKLPADLHNGLVEVVQGDLENDADLETSLKGIECVQHLARAIVKTWADYQAHDIEVTRRIAERCLGMGVKRLIYTGTIDSYYAGAKAGVITEETPLDPHIDHRNLYARAKAVSEQMLLQMHRERGLPLLIVRPGIVIGRGGSPFHWGVGMWRHGSICQLWGDGRNKLPFVLVEDVARGLIAAMEAKGVQGQSFNLIGDPCLSGQEYLDELERFAEIKLQRMPTPIWRFYLQDMLKWVVKVMVKHPERRMPSYGDWESRTQQARFDCSRTRTCLQWQPTSDREVIIRQGIHLPLQEVMR